MSTKSLLITIALAACIFVALISVTYATYPTMIGANQVILKAKSWNNGKVHVWQTLVESEATYVDVRDGTRCDRLDGKMHPLIGPPPLIYYYRVNCDDITGYVEIDQVR